MATWIRNFILRLAFAPRTCRTPSKDIEYYPRNDGSGKVEYIYFEPPETRYLLVLLHGQARTLDSRSVKRWKKLSNEKKFSLLMHNYPGYGETPGNPTAERIYQDTAELIKMVQKERGCEQRIMALGNSLGCAPTLWLAARGEFKIEKVAIISPYVSLLPLVLYVVSSTLMGRFSYLSSARQLSVAQILGGSHRLSFLHGTKCDPLPCHKLVSELKDAELLIIHGERDTIIPISHSEALYATAKNSNIITTLVKIPNTVHSDARSRAEDAIGHFFSGDEAEFVNALERLRGGEVQVENTEGLD